MRGYQRCLARSKCCEWVLEGYRRRSSLQCGTPPLRGRRSRRSMRKTVEKRIGVGWMGTSSSLLCGIGESSILGCSRPETGVTRGSTETEERERVPLPNGNRRTSTSKGRRQLPSCLKAIWIEGRGGEGGYGRGAEHAVRDPVHAVSDDGAFSSLSRY